MHVGIHKPALQALGDQSWPSNRRLNAASHPSTPPPCNNAIHLAQIDGLIQHNGHSNTTLAGVRAKDAHYHGLLSLPEDYLSAYQTISVPKKDNPRTLRAAQSALSPPSAPPENELSLPAGVPTTAMCRQANRPLDHSAAVDRRACTEHNRMLRQLSKVKQFSSCDECPPLDSRCRTQQLS